MKTLISLIVLTALATSGAVAQWKQLPGPTSFIPSSMYVDDSVVIVTTFGSGFVRYGSDGVPLHFNSGAFAGATLLTVRGIEGKLYLGGGKGIYTSTDAGSTWAQPAQPPNKTIYALLEQNDVIYVGTGLGVFRSTDNGGTWDKAFTATADPVTALAGWNNEVFAAFQSTPAAIFRTADTGLTQRSVEIGIDSSTQVLTMYFADDVALVGSNSGIFRSVDSAKSWRVIPDPTNQYHDVYDFLPVDDMVFACGSGGCIVSIDRGLSWKSVSTGFPDIFFGLSLGRRGDTLFYCDIMTGVWYRSISEMLSPKVTISATNTAMCEGDSVELIMSANVIAPIASMRWNDGDTASQRFVSPHSDTRYIVQVIDERGRVGADTIDIQVNTAPTVQLGNDITICTGTSVRLGRALGARYAYSWTPAAGLTDTNAADPIAKPASSTSYILAVTDRITGCIGRDTINVIVTSLLIARAGNDRTICWGSSTKLGDTSHPGYSYAWIPAEGLDDSSIAQPTASPDSSTTYILTTSVSGCIARDTVHVTVQGRPRAWVVRLTNDSLTALPAGTKYQWLLRSVPIPGATSQTIFAPAPDGYAVTVTDTSGRAMTSVPYVRSDDSLIVGDIYVPFCPIGYEKRMMTPITNIGSHALTIDGVRIIPDDSASCVIDTGSFSIADDLAGVILDPGESVRLFIGFAPQVPKLNAAAIAIDYSDNSSGERKVHHLKTRLLGLPSEDKGFLKASVGLDSVRAVLPGIDTKLTFRVGDIGDSSGTVKPWDTSSDCGFRYALTIVANATLLAPQPSGVESGCGFPPSFTSLKGSTTLYINDTGFYKPSSAGENSFNIEFPFQAMLGNAIATTIKVAEFKWIGNPQTYEIYQPPTSFALQGVCIDSAGPRLIALGLVKHINKLSPNPADKELVIDYDLPAGETAGIAIYDVHGSMVRSLAATEGNAGRSSTTIDVADLSNGSYFVVMSTKSGVGTARLDIMH
jgi:hypothetical protein